eukprot:5180562-Prymnesium_polylepis.1
METDHLHAIFDSPLVRATHPLRLSQPAALREHVVERRRANRSTSDRPPGARIASSNAARPGPLGVHSLR